MLKSVEHWLEIANIAFDVLFLLRILGLKLHRAYALVTLSAVLTVFFDGVFLWFGPESDASGNVSVYAQFLWAAIFPLIALDIFDDLLPKFELVKRMALFRVVSGYIALALFAGLLLLISGDATAFQLAATAGLMLFAMSSLNGLLLIVQIRKWLQAQGAKFSRNTHVWIVFFVLTFALNLLACVGELLPILGAQAVHVAVLVCSIPLTSWAIWRLRSASENGSAELEKVAS